ncbi:MAG: iron-containing alcohol dehydrogenase [Alphaproteobacteria bacterium]|nr:iron-containing alcohol dehydrogenase [Alphaproteobacteria bacterium]
MTMRRVQWGGPAPLDIGQPADEALRTWISQYGLKRPLFVTEGDDRGPIDPLVYRLEAAGVSVQSFDRAHGANIAVVADAVAQYHFEGCDGLIAVGGWTPTMVAKATALMVGQRVPLSALSETLGADRALVDPTAIPPLAVVADTIDAAAATGGLIHIIDDAAAPMVLRHVGLRPRLMILDPERDGGAATHHRTAAAATLVLRAIDGLSTGPWPFDITPALQAVLDDPAPWDSVAVLAGVLEDRIGPAWTLATVAAARAELPATGVFAALMPTAAHVYALDPGLQDRAAVAASMIPLHRPLPTPLLDVSGLRALAAVARNGALVDVRPLLAALNLDMPRGPTRAGGRRGRRRDVA